MELAWRVRVSGPLAGEAPDLIGVLEGSGYRESSTVDHVRCLAHLSRWLETEGLEPAAVDEVLVAAMVEAWHGTVLARKFRPGSYRVVLGFLRERGVVAPVAPAAPGVFDGLLGDYRAYLVGRGLATLTVPGYVSAAARFLGETCGEDPGRVVGLSASDVASFVARAAESLTPASVNTLVVSVRSLLRWLYVDGRIDRPLAQAAPWLASGALSTLPRSVEPGQAEVLLGTCDRSRLAGARDFAVLTVLARLGLRAGEIAAMELSDIDWRRGRVTVRSKGGWRDPLPLPVDVGEAIAAYLRLRGAEPEFPQVFLRVHAPRGPMKLPTVRAVVREACERAGIADVGTHRLRHGTAADLLRNGAGLPEIGQVLRHRDLETTAMYAKVDFAALVTVARDWPGSDQ